MSSVRSWFAFGGSAPATPGFNAVAPEWLFGCGAAYAAPAIPASESALGSHPCVALSSAQVFPEWMYQPSPSTFLQRTAIAPLTSCLTPGVHFSFHQANQTGKGSRTAPAREGYIPAQSNPAQSAREIRQCPQTAEDAIPSGQATTGKEVPVSLR
jgi:hypothetical protein